MLLLQLGRQTAARVLASTTPHHRFGPHSASVVHGEKAVSLPVFLQRKKPAVSLAGCSAESTVSLQSIPTPQLEVNGVQLGVHQPQPAPEKVKSPHFSPEPHCESWLQILRHSLVELP